MARIGIHSVHQNQSEVYRAQALIIAHGDRTRGPDKMSISTRQQGIYIMIIAPFGDAYEKIGTIQRRLAWPLHKDDTLFQSGRPTGLNIYFFPYQIIKTLKDLMFSDALYI